MCSTFLEFKFVKLEFQASIMSDYIAKANNAWNSILTNSNST